MACGEVLMFSDSAERSSEANLRVTLYGLSEGNYLSQWLAGLVELAAIGEIELRYAEAGSFESLRLQRGAWLWLKLEIANPGGGEGEGEGERERERQERLLFLDLMDSSRTWDIEALKRCDVYFKRAFVSDDISDLPPELQRKVQRMPLQYPVSSSKQDVLQRVRRSIASGEWRSRPVRGARSLLGSLFREAPGAQRLGVRKPAPVLADLRGSPAAQVAKRIYFRTRLYEPRAGATEKQRQHISELNNARIQFILDVREAFGELAYCGLYETEVNARIAPDLIKPLPSDYAMADGHRMFSRHSLINLNTVGVTGSNGWKIGEILAAGSCLVTEKLQHESLDALVHGEHAEEFETTGDCIVSCRKLLDNPECAAAMRRAGFEFFDRFLTPQASTKRLLKAAEQSAGDNLDVA